MKTFKPTINQLEKKVSLSDFPTYILIPVNPTPSMVQELDNLGYQPSESDTYIAFPAVNATREVPKESPVWDFIHVRLTNEALNPPGIEF